MTDRPQDLHIHLSDNWWAWRETAIRAAGFAIDDLVELGQPKLAAAADLAAGLSGGDPAQADEADAGFRADYEAAVQDCAATLAQITDSEPFRRALTWQNRRLVKDALEPYLAAQHEGGPRNGRFREREILLTKYVQRYHSKNESIGFFGAVGWARWTGPGETGARWSADQLHLGGADDAALNAEASRLAGARSEGGLSGACQPAMTVAGYSGQVVENRIQFENWAMGLLGQHFSRTAEVRRWLAPVLAPTVRLLGDGQVHSAVFGAARMPQPRYAVLAACDGTRSVLEICQDLMAAGVPGIGGVGDAESILGILERTGYVALGIAVPPTFHPDRHLRRTLEAIAEPSIRAELLGVMDRLQGAAARIREATLDSRRLAAAMADLDEEFTAATGQAASRSDAAKTPGRMLMIEDCQNSLRVTMDARLLADLAAPLRLLLISSRWMAEKVSGHYHEIAGQIYDRMATPDNPRVGLAAICYELWPRMAGEAFPGEAAGVLADMTSRWSKILAIPEGARRHEINSAAITAEVERQFAAPTMPWLSGRFNCPDLMIAATDAAAVDRGDYSWVIGELHTAQNTLNQSSFVLSHPEPDRIQALADANGSHGLSLVPMYPAPWPQITARGYPPPYLPSPTHDYLRMSAEPPRDKMPGPGLPMSALTMVRRPDGELRIECEDGRSWHPMAVLGEFLIDGLGSCFTLFAWAPHRPRISIDRLVISREQWRVPPESITWRGIRDEASRYQAVRRWAADLGLPRFIFLRIVGTAKPYYVDLTSPVLVNMVAAALRSAARRGETSAVTISEMYPDPEHLWAPHGPNGRRCTSELRMSVVERPDGFPG